MRHRTQFIGTIFVLTTVLASSAAFAQNAAGAAAVRPAGYKPKAGDPVAGEITDCP